MKDINIINAFSIKVASVIGKSRAVPRQAHLIVRFDNSVFVTPIVVNPKMIIVAKCAIVMFHLNRNISPIIVSRNGYNIP